MAAYTVDYTGIQGHVYTLLLEGGNYYVGWSSSVENRIAQHFLGDGSKWTMLHSPIQVLACVAGDTRLEDVVTISLMCRHGWERVRGGRWCQVALEAPPDPVKRAREHLKLRPDSGPLLTAQVNNPDRTECAATDHDERASPALAQQEESLKISRNKADGEPHAWRAEVRNAQAANECAARGFKCIYGATLQELTARICDWRQSPEATSTT